MVYKRQPTEKHVYVSDNTGDVHGWLNTFKSACFSISAHPIGHPICYKTELGRTKSRSLLSSGILSLPCQIYMFIFQNVFIVNNVWFYFKVLVLVRLDQFRVPISTLNALSKP